MTQWCSIRHCLCAEISRIILWVDILCYSAYEQKLTKFIFLISSLSGNCASYVVEDVRRLLYLRDGKISRSADLAPRKEACRSLARLAYLRKNLEKVQEDGGRFACNSSADALVELEASLAGALAYRSSDGKHPAVYIQVASLFPTSLYLQVTPAALQRLLLSVFDRVWQKLGAASRLHGEKISHGMRRATRLTLLGVCGVDPLSSTPNADLLNLLSAPCRGP